MNVRRNRGKAGVALAVILLVTVSAAIWYFRNRPGDAPPPAKPAEQIARAPIPKRVILISIDTLRADHLSVYGYSRDTTPALNTVARQEGIKFERAHSCAPRTLPSMMSLMTSLYPTQHQIENRGDRLSKEIPTLAAAFKINGWHTTAFITHIFVSHLFGFDNGYDEFHELSIHWNFEEGFQVRAEELNAQVFPWLQSHVKDRFFLHLHYFDPHWDYDPPAPFNKKFTNPDYRGPATGSFKYLRGFLRKQNPMPEADLRHVMALYDGEIAYTDHNLDALFQKLKSLGMWEDTLLVVLADHGEEFKEHGSLHHHTLYEENLHVPLIIKLPGGRPAGWRDTVRERVSTIDVSPTILDICRLKPLPSFQGVSLVPLLQKSARDRVIYARIRNEKTFGLAAIDNDYKLLLKHGLHEDTTELFHLATDPSEQNSIYPQQPRVADLLQKALFKWVKQGEASPYAAAANREKVQLDEQQKELLKSLGYVD